MASDATELLGSPVTPSAAGRLPLTVKLAYGAGAVGYNVKEQGFNYFLLFFYSQVLGLSASLAGSAIFIALLVDAVSDPLIGMATDRLRSRWGRRHPFMYASALPAALCFFVMWNPPAGLEGQSLYAFLLAVTIALNLSITLFEIPSIALVSELTQDYHDRTSLLSYRYLFGWIGALLLAALTYALLLTPTASQPNGFLNVSGYATYGLVGSLAMAASILACAIGTQHLIPTLPRAAPHGKRAARQVAAELRLIFSNRSFLAAFTSTLVLGLGAAIAAALAIYFNSFFWKLRPDQVALIALGGFVSAPAAYALAPRAALRWEKKKAALIVAAAAFVIAPMPVILRLAGLFPANGSPVLFPLLATIIVVDLALVIAAQILIASMFADIPDQSEVATGRRSEGTIFAAQMFARKAVSGLGVLIAGWILESVAFPTDGVTRASPAAIRAFAMTYVPIMLAIYAGGLVCLSFYSIGRADHHRTLELLRRRAADDAIGQPGGPS